MFWGFVPLAAMLPFLIWRLFDEERLLSESLPGYLEYQQKIPHRIRRETSRRSLK